MDEPFGAWLANAGRRKCGSVGKFADAIGMARPQMTKYTKHGRRPEDETLQKFADGLELPFAELVARRSGTFGAELAQNGGAGGSDRVPGIIDRAHEKLLEKLERDVRRELEVIEEEDGEEAADDLADIMAGAFSGNTRAILATRRRERERQRAMKT